MERGDPITWAVPPPAYVPPKNEATEKSKPVPVAGSPVRTLNDPPYEQENIVVNSSSLTVQKISIFSGPKSDNQDLRLQLCSGRPCPSTSAKTVSQTHP